MHPKVGAIEAARVQFSPAWAPAQADRRGGTSIIADKPTLQSEIGLACRDSAAVKTVFQAVQALVDRLDGRLQRLVLGEPPEDASIMDVATMRRDWRDGYRPFKCT